MRLTSLEIAFGLTVAMFALACVATLLSSRAEDARHAAGRAAVNRARASAPLAPEDPRPEQAILAALARDDPPRPAGWPPDRVEHACGCVRFLAGQPQWLRCGDHAAKAVDDEIAGWRI